jgi:hypothetical protein
MPGLESTLAIHTHKHTHGAETLIKFKLFYVPREKTGKQYPKRKRGNNKQEKRERQQKITND